MRTQEIPLLGRALLGLLFQNPCSGYDIRRFFISSPMGSFSDSPGAIYPALQRLEKQGLLRGQVQEQSRRRKKVFHLTLAGTAALRRWLTQPVTRDDVIRGMEGLILRFSFTDLVLGGEASLHFLEALQQELLAYVPSLRDYLHSHCSDMPHSGALALESGILQYETLLSWCKDAIKSYEARNRGGKPS